MKKKIIILLCLAFAATYAAAGPPASPPGTGTGDLLSTNNLGDVGSAATSRSNLGLVIGTDVQAYNANTDTDNTDDYTVGGTDVALADGGTGASLVDPNADRIGFWDDSAGAFTWLTVGSGLTVTGTTIAASGGGSGDFLADGTVPTTGDIQIGNGLDLRLATTTTAHEFSLQGYDVDGTTWLDVLNIANGNTVTVTALGAWDFSGAALTFGQSMDFGDYDTTSIDKLEGYDTGIFIDMGADGVLQLASDTSIHLDVGSESLQLTSGTNTVTIGTDTGVTEINTALDFVTTGTILAGINISLKTAATYTAGTDDADESNGTMFVNNDNDAIDFTLDTAAAGKSMCFMQGAGVSGAITVQPGTGDQLIDDGVAQTAATDFTSAGAGGDKLCVVAVDSTYWLITSKQGTWSE